MICVMKMSSVNADLFVFEFVLAETGQEPEKAVSIRTLAAVKLQLNFYEFS